MPASTASGACQSPLWPTAKQAGNRARNASIVAFASAGGGAGCFTATMRGSPARRTTRSSRTVKCVVLGLL